MGFQHILTLRKKCTTCFPAQLSRSGRRQKDFFDEVMRDFYGKWIMLGGDGPGCDDVMVTGPRDVD